MVSMFVSALPSLTIGKMNGVRGDMGNSEYHLQTWTGKYY